MTHDEELEKEQEKFQIECERNREIWKNYSIAVEQERRYRRWQKFLDKIGVIFAIILTCLITVGALGIVLLSKLTSIIANTIKFFLPKKKD